MIKHFATHRGTLDNVFDLEDGFDKTIWMEELHREGKKDSDSARMLEERYMGPEYNLDEGYKITKEFARIY